MCEEGDQVGEVSARHKRRIRFKALVSFVEGGSFNFVIVDQYPSDVRDAPCWKHSWTLLEQRQPGEMLCWHSASAPPRSSGRKNLGCIFSRGTIPIYSHYEFRNGQNIGLTRYKLGQCCNSLMFLFLSTHFPPDMIFGFCVEMPWFRWTCWIGSSRPRSKER